MPAVDLPESELPDSGNQAIDQSHREITTHGHDRQNNHPTALVVDDSRMMRLVLSKALKEVGFTTVHEAGNGQEGLDLLATIPCPALALVDWNMPTMNGLAFVKRVRSNHAFRNLRMLMVSTEGADENKVAATAAGADGYQNKPFSAEGIRASISALGMQI